MKVKDKKRFAELVNRTLDQANVQNMKSFLQHGRVTTFEHAMAVAKLSYRIDRFFHIKSSDTELVRGALLHDYYLYDWHHFDGPLHGPYHPKKALENATEDFKDLTDKEKNIIASHMWPLGISRVPKSREAVLVCIADKIVSTKETLFMR